MSDVFVSYRRDDKGAVAKLVTALRDAGVSVWWDDDIPPDAPWESTIETALERAKVVIVCWSKSAVLSENVKGEARRARNHGKLIQVFLEPCEPPLFFGERQGVDLTDWSGSDEDARFRSVHAAACAVRDGKAPPRGVGYIPKRRTRWPMLLLLPLALMALPVGWDWTLAARLVLLIGAGVAIWKGNRLIVAAAVASGLIVSTALDVARYRLAPEPYYSVQCSIGDINCLASRDYKFGKRTVRLYPLPGGALQRVYVSVLAGEERHRRSFLQKERIGSGEAFLSPAELEVLAYLDGGAASQDVAVVYQPLSRGFNPDFPWGKAVFEIGADHHARPDIRGELLFSAGMILSGEQFDLFDPGTLLELNASAPSYHARRSAASSFGFVTPIESRDESQVWKRAVINDQLFQLYAADNLDEVLAELAADYTGLSDIDRLLYDALALSYWCTQNQDMTTATIACASEASRLASEVLRLTPPDAEQIAAKPALIRQILGLVVAYHLGSIDTVEGLPASKGLSLDDYSSAVEVRQLLVRDLIQRFPDLRSLGLRPVSTSGVAPIDPVTASDGAFSEYMAGLAHIGRTDALQTLIPLRRSLVQGYSATNGGPDLFAWGRAIWSDLPGVSLEGEISADRLPATFGLMKQALAGSQRKQVVFERYKSVDAAINALGGVAPPELVRSRRMVEQERDRELAMNDLHGELVQRLERGSTLTELSAIADKPAFAQLLVPEALQVARIYVDAASVALKDLEIDGGEACAGRISSRLTEFEKAVRAAGAGQFVDQFKDALLTADGLKRFWEQQEKVINEDCAKLAAEFHTEKLQRAWIFRYLNNVPLLQSPQEYLAGDPNKDGLVSSRQYVLSTAFETAARTAAAASWLAEEERRREAWNQGTLFVQKPGAQDFAGLRDTICSKWREPVWAYSELGNKSVGWRRLPLFFAILSISSECEGAPNAQVRAHLASLLGEEIVNDYLAGEKGRASRIHAGGQLEPGVIEAISAAPEWSWSDAYTYAQLLLYEDEYKAFGPYRTDAPFESRSIQLCGDKPCDPEERFLASALHSYLQSISSAADLHAQRAGEGLFLQTPELAIDEDRLEELTELGVPSIATAFADIRNSTTSEKFKAVAEPLLRKPSAKEFAAIEAFAQDAALTGETADRLWIEAHRLFAASDPDLSLRALEHVSAEGAYREVLPIRKTVLLLRARKFEQATRLAVDDLKARVETTDALGIRLSLENARQAFLMVDCQECRARLASAVFRGFSRLDDIHGGVREDRYVRGRFARLCLGSADPALHLAANEAADAVLDPFIESSKRNPASPDAAGLFDPEFLSTNAAVRFAIGVKASIGDVVRDRANSPAALFILKGLERRTDIQPNADALDIVGLLLEAAGPEGGAPAAALAQRSGSVLAQRIAAGGALDAQFDSDLAALAYLADVGEAVLIETLDKLTGRMKAEYQAGQFNSMSPLRLLALMDRALPPNQWKADWRPPNGVVARYLASPVFEELVDACGKPRDICLEEMSGLAIQIKQSAGRGEIIPRAKRDLVLDLAQEVIKTDPARMSFVAGALIKELDEPPLTIVADLMADGGLSAASSGGDFLTLSEGMGFIGLVMTEAQNAKDPALAGRVEAMNLRLAEKVLEDYLPDVTGQGCCFPTEVDSYIASFLTYRIARPDACAWLEASGVNAAAFARQKLREDKNLGHKSPLLARLRDDPASACAGKSYSDGIASLDGKIAVNPADASALYTRGRYQQALKNYVAAVKDFDAAASADKTVVAYQNARCWYRAISDGDLEIAREACDSGLALDPKNANLFDSRGLVGLKQSRFEDAWRDYNAAVGLDPGQASAWLGRGIAALRLGRAEEGYADIAAAVKLDPGIRQTYRDWGVEVRQAKTIN